MKYDGTGWCKQTAAIEEGRRCSCSFTHWCACRPGTKSPLMKVLTEAQGAREEGMVSDNRANQTTPHHTVLYHARAFLPSLAPRHSAPYLACIVCLQTQRQVFLSFSSPNLLTIQRNTEVRLDLKKSTPPSIPSAPFLSPQTRSTALLGPEQSHSLKLPQEQMTSGRMAQMKQGMRHHQRKPVHMKKLPVLFVLRLVCVGVCVCLLAPMSVC